MTWATKASSTNARTGSSLRFTRGPHHSSAHVIDVDEPCWSIAMVVDPIEKLRNAVDLIVVSSVRELFHLGLKIAQPCCALCQKNLSGFDLGCLSMVRGGPFKEGPLAKGAFYRSALLEITDHSMPIAQDEVFGPVLVMQAFDTEAEAVELANRPRRKTSRSASIAARSTSLSATPTATISGFVGYADRVLKLPPKWLPAASDVVSFQKLPRQ